MVQYGKAVGEKAEEAELAHITFVYDAFGCGVLFGLALLTWAAAVWFMFAGLALIGLGLGLFLVVLGACTGDKLRETLTSRQRFRRLQSELDELVAA